MGGLKPSGSPMIQMESGLPEGFFSSVETKYLPPYLMARKGTGETDRGLFALNLYSPVKSH